jgi:hypothetical protein
VVVVCDNLLVVLMVVSRWNTYWPHIDNVWSHRSTQVSKNGPIKTHYYDCRLKGRPPGAAPSLNNPNRKKRRRVARERDLCDMKIKVTEAVVVQHGDGDKSASLTTYTVERVRREVLHRATPGGGYIVEKLDRDLLIAEHLRITSGAACDGSQRQDQLGDGRQPHEGRQQDRNHQQQHHRQQKKQQQLEDGVSGLSMGVSMGVSMGSLSTVAGSMAAVSAGVGLSMEAASSMGGSSSMANASSMATAPSTSGSSIGASMETASSLSTPPQMPTPTAQSHPQQPREWGSSCDNGQPQVDDAGSGGSGAASLTYPSLDSYGVPGLLGEVHRHSLAYSDRIKKCSVHRELLKKSKELKKQQVS